MTKRLLDPKSSALLVIDIQEKFVGIVKDCALLEKRARILVQAAGILGVPIVVSEQYPKGLGPTVSGVRDSLPEGSVVLDKTAFGCLGDAGIKAEIAKLGKKQILVCGLETHVCVNQTVFQLLEEGYEVHLAVDALACRDEKNKEIGLRKMEQGGAIPSCSEMAIFEWMGRSKHENFKELQALIK